MPKLDPERLNDVLREAGVSEKTAKKVRDANGAPPPASESPRGHGASSQDTSSLGEL